MPVNPEPSPPEGPMPGPDALAYGVPTVINLICGLVRVYNRHRENVEGAFPEAIVGALDVLSDGCDVLASMNSPGPRN